MALDQTFAGVQVAESITTFDRLIFKGHLWGMQYPQAVFAILFGMGLLLLKDWNDFVKALTENVSKHLESWCLSEGRQFKYLERSHTHRDKDGKNKDAIARKIAKEENISEGLVCILRVLEPSSSFDVRGNRATKKREIVRRNRRCLHFYVYYIDPEFGWMHIRIQSWLPFTVQVYVNGREWLSRQLDRLGVSYSRSDNKILSVDNIKVVEKLTQKLVRMNWVKVLDKWAKMVNPLLPRLSKANKNCSYYWVTDQCEYATDLIFKDRSTVDKILPELLIHAQSTLSVKDCFRFLGKKESKAEAIIDFKHRPEGWRIKFRVGRNSVKIYDHANLIRFETTINHPAAFRVIRHEDQASIACKKRSQSSTVKPRKKALRKGVIDFWLLARIAGGCNQRMIDSCDTIRTTQDAIDHLDTLAKPKTVKGRHIPRLNALAPENIQLFKALSDGSHCIRGFSNRDLQNRIFAKPAKDHGEKRKRICKITRRIACLRGHGLVAKVPRANLYHLTKRGRHVISSILRFHELDYAIPISA